MPRDQIKLNLLLFPPLLLCRLLRTAQPCFSSHEGFVFMQICLSGAPSSRQDTLYQVPLVAAGVLRGGLRPVGSRRHHHPVREAEAGYPHRQPNFAPGMSHVRTPRCRGLAQWIRETTIDSLKDLGSDTE